MLSAKINPTEEIIEPEDFMKIDDFVFCIGLHTTSNCTLGNCWDYVQTFEEDSSALTNFLHCIEFKYTNDSNFIYYPLDSKFSFETAMSMKFYGLSKIVVSDLWDELMRVFNGIVIINLDVSLYLGEEEILVPIFSISCNNGLQRQTDKRYVNGRYDDGSQSLSYIQWMQVHYPALALKRLQHCLNAEIKSDKDVVSYYRAGYYDGMRQFTSVLMRCGYTPLEIIKMFNLSSADATVLF